MDSSSEWTKTLFIASPYRVNDAVGNGSFHLLNKYLETLENKHVKTNLISAKEFNINFMLSYLTL